MSQQVANVNLSAATLGPPATTGTVSWRQLLTPPTIEQQMQPGQTSGATLLVQNESHAQLSFFFPDTNRTVSWPAGKWAPLKLRANETSLVYTVTGLASNPLFTSLLVDFYWPGEPVDDAGTLGNSPIGGGVPLSVSQVINNANPTPTVVLQSTPSGSSTVTAQITNDGHELLEPNNPNTGTDVAFQVVDQNNPVTQGRDAVGFLQQVAGDAISRASLRIRGADGFAQLALSDGTAAHSFTIVGTSTGVSLSGAISGIGGVSAIAGGKRNVPLIIGRGDDVNVALSGSATIAIATVPNESPNPIIRCSGMFLVNTSDTNSGIITFAVSFTDPYANAGTAVFFTLNGTTTLLNGGATVAQRATQYNVYSITAKCKPNTSVSITYQNGAAGSFSDFVSAIIELL